MDAHFIMLSSDSPERPTSQSPVWTDEDACLEYLFQLRFADTVCSKCGKQNTFYRHRTKRCYTCSCGRQHIYPTVGTLFERSKLPLSKWIRAVWIASITEERVRPVTLQQELHVSYVTAFKIAQKLNGRLAAKKPASFRELLHNCIE